MVANQGNQIILSKIQFSYVERKLLKDFFKYFSNQNLAPKLSEEIKKDLYLEVII
jgi:hypothetical protein